jgi:SMODS-associating 4TM effector domain
MRRTSGARLPRRPHRPLRAAKKYAACVAGPSHQRGQLIEAIQVNAAVALAAAGIVVTLVGHGRLAASVIGAAWFAVSAFFLGRAANSTTRQGALLQEMFDTALFYLP